MAETPKRPSRKPRRKKAREASAKDKERPVPASARDRKPSVPRVIVGGPLKWTLVVLALSFGAAMVYFFVVYPERKNAGVGRDVELELEGDETPDVLAARLHAAGVVGWPKMFSIYVRARGATAAIARGPHLFTDDLSPREVVARVTRRLTQKAKLVVPEGFTRFDIAKRLQAARIASRKAFLDATTDGALLASLRIEAPSAEGYLFPATYELPQDSAPAEVVRRMKLEFDRRYAVLEERHGSSVNELQSSLGWGRREIVTMAAIVEKEAVVDDERPIIAGVFLNRLRDPKFSPKLLQSDPTAGYGCLVDPTLLSCRTFTGKITPSLLADPSNAYNTYKHVGLPPGPIANPGARSIEAVMAPATTRALYFVAKGGGRHTFSETYEAHQAAIKAGRSPAPPKEDP